MEAASDANGVVKGVSFQCCPAALSYRRSIAKDVLGTDDPVEVQTLLNSWDKFEAVAADAKAKGYYMTGSFAADYRVFSNNVSAPWVDAGNNLTMDAELAKLIGQDGEAERVLAEVSKVEEAVQSAGWDGEWFVRAYDAFSNPVGSHLCDEGKIYIEPQGMCVMAGIGVTNGKAEKALNSVRTHLLGKFGVELLAPCYTVYHKEAAYQATFDLSKDWTFSSNIFLDSLFFRGYDQTAPEAVKRFADSIPASDWSSMEAPDFIGLNTYQGEPVEEDASFSNIPAGFPRTAFKWKITPEVTHFAPMNLYRRYGKPVMITENGLSCNDHVYLDGKVHDADRIDFLHRYLLELHKAIDEGTPVIGYLQWSFLDNFEWAMGYNERFGIVYVDYETLHRTPKDSAQWYAEVIASNGNNL